MVVREKDNQVRAKDEQLKRKDEQLREKDKQLREKDEQLRVKDEQLKTKEGELKDLRDQLQDFAVVQNKLSAAEKQLTKYESQSGSPDWVLCRDEVHFNWDQSLGAGSFGQVFKGRYCGCVVAIKKLHFLTLSQKQRDSFEREMKIASRCRHPCLLQFIGATQDESPLFVTELMETSLKKLLKKRKQENQHLSETEIIVICLDVARALNYLHRRQPPIVHRDVSSANVLLWKQNNQWRGKLGDYGTAKFLQDTMTAHPGTQIYEAPEIRYPSGQTVAIDVFSFGVLFCEMCKVEPPEPENREDIVRQLTNKNFGELILWCIEHDAKMRPSMGDIIENLEQLNHTS
ncbi:uncharacterized protein [Porites lutea]|uniref:uncharacterized protein n=1 Tax=Porites lutea TaxID=51062 RepID=UPI003CC57DC5